MNLDISCSQTIILEESKAYRFEFFETQNISYASSIHIESSAPNVSLEIVGKIVAQQTQKKSLQISIILQGESQRALLDIKGIGDDNASLKIEGGVIVGKHSQSASVEVREKVILLSPHAKAHVTPILRVETQNVLSASHSASVAPFSDDLFFFLESRGISPKEAKKMLVDGMMA